MNLENVHSVFIARNENEAIIYSNARSYHNAIWEIKHNFIHNFIKYLESGKRSKKDILNYIDINLAEEVISLQTVNE